MSRYQFKLPDIGEGIAEGTIGEWHVKPGDEVQVDGELVQIENDKSVEELPSPVAGKVIKILVAEGETAEVGDPLIELEVAEGLGNVDESQEEVPAQEANAEVKPQETTPATPAIAATNAPSVQDHSLPVLAMPVVRAYAREKGVDLTQVKGTGNHDQILRSDIDQFLTQGSAPIVVSEEQEVKQPAKAPQVIADAAWPQHAEKMSAVRYATAKSVARSVQEIPHVHVFDEVVVDKLWEHRAKYKELALQKDVRLTFLAYIVKAVAVVLKEFPIFNSVVDMDNKQMIFNDFINVGIATDTERGLFMPNIKHADQMSLFGIAKQITENTAKAKEGKLTVEDMKHASISLTNIGSVGGGFFTPIVNWPEVAILGIGRITKEAVVQGDEVVAARVLKLSLAFDHRVIDGATAQKALNRLKELLGEPELLLMEG